MSEPEVHINARCLTCGDRARINAPHTYDGQHHAIAEWWALHKEACHGKPEDTPIVILRQGRAKP
jgi:hypothetical protein